MEGDTMKRLIINLIVIAAISLLGIMWINSDVFSQEIPIQEQIKNMNIEIPFVDRDGDGINDLLQNGWGLRFLRRFKNRGAVWTQMMENEEFGNTLIDTDGDGVPDTSLREIFQKRMEQRMDSNGDGVFDTVWGEFMKRRFELFDLNGDGIPDELTPEQIREHFQEMREWMQMMRENLKNGLPAFVDEDGDGIPDNLPQGFGWMKRHKGKGKIGGKSGGL